MSALRSAVALVVLTLACASQESVESAAEAPTVGPFLVVLNKSGASVSLLDPGTGAVSATLPVGAGPHEAATAADGRTIVVCNYGQQNPGGSLTVIDALEARVLRTIELVQVVPGVSDDAEPETRRFLRPHGVAFLPDGDHVIVTTELQRRLVIVDVRNGLVVDAIDTGANLSHMVTTTPDARRAFVANIGDGSISAVDLVERSLLGVVETGAGSEGIAAHPSRPEVWVTNRSADTLSVVDTAALAEVAELPCGKFPIRVAFTPDGVHALVSCARDGTVEVWNVAKRERVATIAMDEKPRDDATGARLFAGSFDASPVPVGILVQPDGRFAYVANTQADVVTVIDLGELAVARRLRAGPEPDGMSWVPAQEARRLPPR